MVTGWKVARESTPFAAMLCALAWHGRWGWFAWIAFSFAMWLGLTVALWVSEAEVREMAAEGYVEGEPLLMHYRFNPERKHKVTYIEPTHGSHKVRLGGDNGVDIYVESERLTRPVIDLRGVDSREPHLPS